MAIVAGSGSISVLRVFDEIGNSLLLSRARGGTCLLLPVLQASIWNLQAGKGAITAVVWTSLYWWENWKNSLCIINPATIWLWQNSVIIWIHRCVKMMRDLFSGESNCPLLIKVHVKAYFCHFQLCDIIMTITPSCLTHFVGLIGKFGAGVRFCVLCSSLLIIETAMCCTWTPLNKLPYWKTKCCNLLWGYWEPLIIHRLIDCKNVCVPRWPLCVL